GRARHDGSRGHDGAGPHDPDVGVAHPTSSRCDAADPGRRPCRTARTTRTTRATASRARAATTTTFAAAARPVICTGNDTGDEYGLPSGRVSRTTTRTLPLVVASACTSRVVEPWAGTVTVPGWLRDSRTA